MPMGNLDLQGRLNRSQMRIHGTTQMRQAVVVKGGEQVAQNQADNSSKVSIIGNMMHSITQAAAKSYSTTLQVPT
jgi:hypothetical protein